MSNSQEPRSSDSVTKLKRFVTINCGCQMSGIKSEDFVSSNYTPLFNAVAGKWLRPYIALQIGYKGFYFNYIADDVKHYYTYCYGEAVLDLNEAIFPEKINKHWSLLLHAGPGYFYNHHYGKPNLCANVGVQNTCRLNSRLQINFDVSSIMGWDIYQGNDDILPGITFGMSYNF